MQDNTVVGTITSGDYGHRVGMNLAYAFVKPNFAAVGSSLQLDLCGEHIAAHIIESSPYDPRFEHMRA